MGVNPKMNYTKLLKLPLSELLFQANKIRQEHIGTKLELCNIINAKSGHCGENCKFCAQSSHYHADISTYALKSSAEIIKAAQRAKDIGSQKFGIVTSGNRLTTKELKEIAFAIAQIKQRVGIVVCVSSGALNKEELKMLKKAGLSCYHHNVETSRRFYSEIVSTHKFDERVNTVKAAKSMGLSVCSGGIIGMGENWQDRIDMALILKELDVDSVPINMLVPIKGTPLESNKTISREDAIRTICIFRIILKDKIIKIAAGREAVLGDSQRLGFMAGANGMLIGGYLTVKGAELQKDYELIKQIKKIWQE